MAIIYKFPSNGESNMEKTTVLKVADAFLSMESMSHKKLQKLCYYAYSWYYALYNKHLFKNSFEAWVHGPVDPGLYHEYKSSGWLSIPKKNLDSDFDKEVFEFVHHVYESYGHLDGDELEYLTHTEDPWKNARGDLPDFAPSNNPITDKEIKVYYQKAFENGQNE